MIDQKLTSAEINVEIGEYFVAQQQIFSFSMFGMSYGKIYQCNNGNRHYLNINFCTF